MKLSTESSNCSGETIVYGSVERIRLFDLTKFNNSCSLTTLDLFELLELEINKSEFESSEYAKEFVFLLQLFGFSLVLPDISLLSVFFRLKRV